MFSRAYVEITNVCDLACAFCPGTSREKGFMTPERFALLAGKLRPYTDYLYLHVMGEPLLHPQLADILRICEELGVRVCLTTNGTHLAQRLPLLFRLKLHRHRSFSIFLYRLFPAVFAQILGAERAVHLGHPAFGVIG